MSQGSFRIRGAISETDNPPWALAGQVGLTSSRRLLPGRAREGAGGELEVAADEVVRVELENGFVLWSRADDLVREYGRQALARDGGQAWEFGALAPTRGGVARGDRGLLGLGIKMLDFFGVDLKGKAAVKLGDWIEEKPLTARTPGLYRCSLGDALQLTALAADESIPAGHGPVLVFLHGTASSCAGSFGKLWAADNAEGRSARASLQRRYGERVYALEHRSLTESPIANALALAERIEAGAELHLVSHSRGGMVGELMCLAGCEDLAAMLTPARIEQLFAADRTIAQQIGLGPLNSTAAQARDAAYQADRERLGKLVQELSRRALKVTRFVRVACPARGTTLASGRLDRWLSVLNFLAEKVTGDGLLSDGLDFLLAVVKARTDPRSLPGVEAMMPGSALTRLLNSPGLTTQADLSVIAGDIEGESLWQKIKIVATDWFYGADHDLVVNTGSMSGGLKRPERGARYRQDQGPEVNHFNYFQNARSVRWLVAGLTRGDAEDGGFLPIVGAKKEAPRWRSAVAQSREAGGARPLALVLPGTMGSHLRVAGEHVWLDYGALFLGGLRKLHMGAEDIEPFDLIDDFYGPLLEFLARSHRVTVFPYDWRLSVRDAAKKLADALDSLLPQAEGDGQPLHLVAHSMGGLVVRAMIADGGRGAALWQRVKRLPGSRFLMLGTPNLGSYEALRWLTGFNATEAKLSLLDITQGTFQIIDLVRRFPGLLELLPFGHDDPDFADAARWQALKDSLQAGWTPADADSLRVARDTWQLLRAAAPEPDIMRYVAGSQDATVVDYQLGSLSFEWDELRGGQKRIEFLATAEGDGTVSWASGRLPGVPTWYVDDTAHDALCAQARAFPAYLEILTTGTTTRLAGSPPTTRRDAGAAPARFLLPAIPPTDGIPAETELRGFGFGGGLPPQLPDEPPAAPVIEVSVSHGDLSYARHPVMVGHYLGDPIVNAESVLDRQLGGALTRRLDLGLYPGALEQHALFFNERANAKPAGAIVVGLGQVGELTPGLLEAGVRAALLDYALQVAHWPDERFGAAGSPRDASLSCLLVGSGDGGFGVRDAIEAILRGAVAANQRLVASELDGCVSITRIEFLEIYEDIAIAACEALQAALVDGQLAAAVRWPSASLEPGQAGRRRVRFGESSPWWHRLQITEEAEREDRLRFVFTTDRARAEETLATGQLALADAFIERASQSARANPEAARTLFEMLLPLRLRELAPQQTDMVLLLDERSARYPWELLEDRWSSNGRPPAVSAGLVRQLKTAQFRARPAHTVEADALVVGNPDLSGWQSFADLPGARREAQRVAELLGSGGFRIRDSIDEKADAILEHLHRKAWRILHLAGHGEHDYALTTLAGQPCDGCGRPLEAAARRISGMVIGRQAFLTPGDIEQMRWVPELVFINCCHLGRTGDPGRGGRDLDRSALAANLGVQFIRMGVRAVVAAGWAVDDGAATVFAETFYRRMLAGDAFGEAVRAAREETWQRCAGVNTWGAYQCYGDPGYRLGGSGAQRPRAVLPYFAPSQFCADLDNLARALQAASHEAGPDSGTEGRIAALMDRVPTPQRASWLARADVAAALGLAWGEARYWSRAIDHLERSLAAACGDCPIRVVEQCANFKLRRAADEWATLAADDSVDPAALEAARQQKVAVIERAILELDILCQRAKTEERVNLLGGACKRLAFVEAAPARRGEALANMARYYRDGYLLARERGSHGAYPFTNWATAQLLLENMAPMLAGDGQADPANEMARVGERLALSNARTPNFWDSVGLADIDLVKLIAACNAADPLPAGKGRSRKAACADRAAAIAALTDAIIQGYRDAIGRGASPREAASVVENIEFAMALTPAQTPLSGALQRIREAL